AISVYYVYQYPVQFSDWLSATQSDPSPTNKADPGGTRTPSFPAQIGMAPPPPPQASPGTDSVSTSGFAGAVPSFQPPTEVITSSISRGGTRAISNDVNGEMPTSEQPNAPVTQHSRLTTNARANSAQQVATE